jgi:P-type E1-E2 ATPase
VIRIHIPGRRPLGLEHLVLDVNGTIACGGQLIEGVAEAIRTLSSRVHIVAITADTFGTADRLRAELGVDVHVISRGDEGQQKMLFVAELGANSVAAIGNGANDAGMLGQAALGIAVLGAEGLALDAFRAADVIVPGIVEALGLLSDERRLIATLRS